MARQVRGDSPVGSFMTAPVVTAAGDTTIREATKALHRARVGTLVVTDGPEVVAIVSERDVVRALAEGADPDQVCVADVMSADPRYLTPGHRADEALRMMLAAGVRHLPVVEEGHLVGIVSIRDLSAMLLP